jgi:chromate reductase
MENKIQLIGISGSLRSGSYNTMLLNSLQQWLPDGVLLETLSFSQLPVYNGDDDLPIKPERPPAVVAFRQALAKADGLVIVSPEYNHSVPGGLKNAIDWASRGKDSPIIKKPVALMGVSDGAMATSRMQVAMLSVFLGLDMVRVGPEVLVARGQDKFDATGKFMDEKAIELIRKQLVALKSLVLQLKKP